MHNEPTSCANIQNFINMHILTWNIEGLKKYSNDLSMKEYFCDFDIVGLCETWSDYQGEFSTFLSDYTCHDEVTTRRGGLQNSGGVSIFVKTNLVRKYEVERIFCEYKNCVLLCFKTSMFHKIQNIIFCFTYVSPVGSAIYNGLEEKDGIKILENQLLSIKTEYPNCALFIAGDLNARCKEFLDYIPDDNLDEIFGEVPYPGNSFEISRNTKDEHTHNLFGNP